MLPVSLDIACKSSAFRLWRLTVNCVQIMREVELHRSLDHIHIVKFHNYFEDDQNIYFILEYCSRKASDDKSC